MTNQEQVINDEKYQSILAYETNTAKVITARVLEKPELSAWMILIPIVFVPFMQRYHRYKESTKGFRAGYLYTKKIALDIAYKQYKKEVSLEEASIMIAKTVQKNPNAEQLVLTIYQHQIEEIKLLSDHYLALLSTNEGEYEQMVISHYQTEANYLGFLSQLAETEKKVNSAASATFKDDDVEVPEIMDKMENKLFELRFQDTKQFFTKR